MSELLFTIEEPPEEGPVFSYAEIRLGNCHRNSDSG